MTDVPSAIAQPYEIVSVRRAKAPPGAEGSNWHHYVIAFERHQQHSRLPTRESQGRDEGGGGDCRSIERTALGPTRPRQPGAEPEEKYLNLIIDHV